MKSKQTTTKAALLAQGLGVGPQKITGVAYPSPVAHMYTVYCLGLYLLQLKCHCILQVFMSHLPNQIKFSENRGCDVNSFLHNAYQTLYLKQEKIC